MADQHRVIAAAQHFVQGHHVSGQRTEVKSAVGRHRGRRVPTHERGHGMESGPGQDRQQACPGMRGIGKPVQAQRQWARPPGLKQAELKAVRPRRAGPHHR